jgi:hypothetical protein
VAEAKVIEYFERSRMPIYLGKRWNTYDGVDIRARAPHVFNYLSNNYYLKVIDGYYVAYPQLKNEKIDEILFSSFDIGNTLEYYSSEQYPSYSYDLNCDDKKSGKYRINNQNNFYYSKLNCGNNRLPIIFSSGKFLGVEKID